MKLAMAIPLLATAMMAGDVDASTSKDSGDQLFVASKYRDREGRHGQSQTNKEEPLRKRQRALERLLNILKSPEDQFGDLFFGGADDRSAVFVPRLLSDLLNNLRTDPLCLLLVRGRTSMRWEASRRFPDYPFRIGCKLLLKVRIFISFLEDELPEKFASLFLLLAGGKSSALEVL
jgi:hypothetical protein